MNIIIVYALGGGPPALLSGRLCVGITYILTYVYKYILYISYYMYIGMNIDCVKRLSEDSTRSPTHV